MPERNAGRRKRVLVACEYSGVVRDAFIARGHDAMSCDLLPTEAPGPHYQGSVFDILGEGWDMMVAHPPCTHLSVSGAAHFAKKQADGRQAAALDFVRALMDCPIPRWAIENPVSIISSRIRKPDQIIQPWHFGDAVTKTTCLWLKGLPPLLSLGGEVAHEGEFVTMKNGSRMSRWHYDSFLLPASERGHQRSKTFPGIANAMADQWGALDFALDKPAPTP